MEQDRVYIYSTGMSHFCHVTFLTTDSLGRVGNRLPPNDNIGNDSCARPDNSIRRHSCSHNSRKCLELFRNSDPDWRTM